MTLWPARRYRLVRNAPAEIWRQGKPSPFAPLYDVEEIDEQWMPVAVIASGVGAVEARAAIERARGIEVPNE